MKQELLNQAVSLFDTPEKWDAFLELANYRDSIKDQFFLKIRDPLFSYFINNPIDGWVCEPWGDTNFDLRWYLKDFGKTALGLGVGWRYDFVLTLDDTDRFDGEKINALLKTPEYSKVLAAFERIDFQFLDPRRKIVEKGNFSFGCPYDANFQNFPYQLAWYAGNRTTEFVNQIIRKVENFRKNQEVTQLLYQLNKESRRDL